MATQDKSGVSFKDTLNLPNTDFPIRSNPKVDDPAMVARWEKEDLFRTSFELHAGNEKFVLHDGPPYSNGHIHIGHAYNKVLKDVSAKSQRMMGKHAPVTPGWDNHGLPIELKVSQEQPNLPPVELKQACRAYAQKWVDIQRKEFKDLGVLMDWDRPYLTMSGSYEASILRAFGVFVADGYIERKNKTVPWCMSCQTVLATAEIEYEDRKDPSIYVKFPLDAQTVENLFPELAGKEVSLLIWTTTPWTLPLNRAVLMHPATEYVILEHAGSYIIVGKALADKICAAADIRKHVVKEFNSQDLAAAGIKVTHPFVEGLKVPLIADQSVLLEEGTAFVHSAPGCGPVDYEVGVKNNLEIYSPISPDGKYTFGIRPTELEGMPVTDGQIWVIKKLASDNRLFFKTTLKHSYPHCWRCHNGLIFRATRQWFCDLEKGNLKQRVLEAIQHIVTIPEKSINRLHATIEGRLEWCLSRQRVWGVPIPALLCQKCDYTYISQGLIDRVAEQVEEHGIEYWDTADGADLLPKGFACPMCRGTDFRKETDILDVWFESGVSHYAVLLNNPELAFPANMYLEGSDQHRAWFQSSLLTAMVLEKQAPMKLIFTHGFVVDGQGRKMSKSIGNVVSPQDVINQVGTDGLRLWAASLDCSGDAVVSETLLKNVAQVLAKIRNTARFLLSNLYDFDIKKDAVPFDQMAVIDQFALQRLYGKNKELQQHYADFDFTAIFHKLGDYCAVDLSSLYLDMIKDRLYVEKADGIKRRSAQTACWHILDTLTKLMAPILSFTAEQVSDHYQKNKTASIHLQQFADLSEVRNFLDTTVPAHARPSNSKELAVVDFSSYLNMLEVISEKLGSLRGAVLKGIEELREKGVVKLPLETRVTVHLDDALMKELSLLTDRLKQHKQDLPSFLKEFFIVSQLIVANDAASLNPTAVKGFAINVEPAHGDKCPRCWQWDQTDHEHKLCNRCQRVLS